MLGLSNYNISVDWEKSHGSYVWDKNNNQFYLDFFSMFSSLPLGWNHPVFKSDSFMEDIRKVSQMKIVNREFQTEEKSKFLNKFIEFTNVGLFSKYAFATTGALAVEYACKTAIDYKWGDILSLEGSFHGVASYGNVTSCRKLTESILGEYPDFMWPIGIKVKSLEHYLKNYRIAGILVEPIRSTLGDVYYSEKEFKHMRELATKYDVPLIFDEIQTGFCATGKKWYFEHLGIEPDIVAFGKKSQVTGVMVKEKFANIFNNGRKISTTWDGDLVDMVRCYHVMNTIEKDDLLNHITQMGEYLKKQLSYNSEFKNIRGHGGVIAFDVENKDEFVKKMYQRGLICNPNSSNNTIRLRPNLNVTKLECDHAIMMLRNCLR